VPEAVGVEATGAEQLRLVAQGGQVAQAVATIGSITARSRSTAASGWRRSPAARQPSALVSLTRSANSRSNAAPAGLAADLVPYSYWAGAIPDKPLRWAKGSTWVLDTNQGRVVGARYLAPLRLKDFTGHY
jgi:hypothetical protein